MKKLHFEYWTDISYSENVSACHYTLKCLPQDTDMQKITDLEIVIQPENHCHMDFDSFGNRIARGDIYVNHNAFCFHVKGTAETDLAISEKQKEDEFVGIYRYPNMLNTAGDGLKKYYVNLNVPDAKEISADANDPQWPEGFLAGHEGEVTDYDRAVYMMNALHRDFIYEPGVTHVGTTAEEAWQLGRGVCQDYAHILIALCHLAGIPARYVTGMMVGEGYSHAWVEILSKGYWYGLDPTNGGVVTSTYIKIAAGRHANDCVINKGLVKGGGFQTQSIRVVVEEIKA